MSYLKNYLKASKHLDQKESALAFMASLDVIQSVDPKIAQAILAELTDQRSFLKMIASENYSSLAVQLAMGNLLTDKYSEGSVGKRFYAGCKNVDTIEALAEGYAKELFGADCAYVQPHSGADANLIAFLAILTVRVQDKELQYQGKKLGELSQEEFLSLRDLMLHQKMVGMSLDAGGHLTHGYRHNISSKLMISSFYEVDSKTHLIDYAAIQKQVEEEKPLILLAGYSSYPRKIDFAKMRNIADSVGAVLMVDMAHFSGLVAGKAFTGVHNPIPYADIVTSTTHKTLRGPRGGLILCKQEFAEAVKKGCPLVIGGPMPHVMAAKAIAFKEALDPSFQEYASQIVQNAHALAERFVEHGASVITGGTENHMVLLDVFSSYGLTGKAAENVLREIGITANRNAIFQDPNGPWITSGLRLGTPALTTIGMKETQMQMIADAIHRALSHTKPKKENGALSRVDVLTDPEEKQKAQKQIEQLTGEFPVYPELLFDEELCQTM